MNRNNDFSPPIIQSIKSQSAFICSNPKCRVLTIAPSIEDEMKVQYTGVVSHITAASKGGPRYDPDNVKCAEIDNAIFLCSNCATMIDKNGGIDYPVETLKKWKDNHLTWVMNNLNKSPFSTPNSNFVSNNQSGGISANIVNVYSPFPDDKKNQTEHDKSIFQRGQLIMSDTLIGEIYDRLDEEGTCRNINLDNMDEFCRFLVQIENTYLNPEIEIAKTAIGSALKELTRFISDKFGKFPQSQPIDNYLIVLEPYLLRNDRYQTQPTMDHKKWHELHAILMELLNTFRNRYNEYRLEVKRSLFV